MTELKLSQSEVTTPESIRRDHCNEDRRVFAAGGLATVVIVGLLITLLFEFGGCSRKREANSSNQNSSNQIASGQAPVVSATDASAISNSQPPKKPAKLRPSTLTYKDSSYGVSFRYPRRYTLKTGDQLNGSSVNGKNVDANTDSGKSGEVNSTGVMQPKGDGENLENHSELQSKVQNESTQLNGGGVQSNDQAKQSGDSKVESREAELKNSEMKNVAVNQDAQSSEPQNLETAFVQPGGVRLAMVEMPVSAYRKTDFAGGFFSVSVNRSLSGEQCEQFGLSEPIIHSGEALLTPPSDSNSQRAKSQIRGMEFTEIDQTIEHAPLQTDAKYYHLFQNGACYEFVLGVETDGSKGGVAPVDREAVFTRLEKILATVRIKPAVAPELESSSGHDAGTQQTALAGSVPKS